LLAAQVVAVVAQELIVQALAEAQDVLEHLLVLLGGMLPLNRN
jgi:hypothetical protein